MNLLLNCCSCGWCFSRSSSEEALADSPKGLPRAVVKMATDFRLNPRNVIDEAQEEDVQEVVIEVPADAKPIEKVAAAYFAVTPRAQTIAVIELAPLLAIDKVAVERNLIEWCEEKKDDPEFRCRQLAANQIRECLDHPQSKTLDLGGLQLTSLPTAIGQLKHLRILKLDRNHLKSLPIEIGNLNQLSELTLWKNNLSEVPFGVCSLIDLVWIDLSENQITHLPEDIWLLQKVEYLNLSENRLQEIPEEFKKLENLQRLNLSHNHLNSGTEILGQLPNLISLDLSKNQLKTISESLNRKNLELYLDHYLSNPPAVLLKKPFYFELVDPDFENGFKAKFEAQGKKYVPPTGN